MPTPDGVAVTARLEASFRFATTTAAAAPAAAPPTMPAVAGPESPPDDDAPAAVPAACAAVSTLVCAIVATAVCPWNAAVTEICSAPLPVGVNVAAAARPAVFVVTASVFAPPNVAF